jgi:spectinomycin phosphotransferase
VLIDWDDVMLAPRERDLMFFTGKEQEPFLSSYDKTKAFNLNHTAIAYYKYEWVVQEIGDYGSQIFFRNVDEITKQHALQEFYKLFAPDDVVQEAYAFDVDRHI